MDACEPFRGKTITLMGLGVLGRGVGDAKFLAECGAQLIVTDKKSEAELAESVAQLKQYPNIQFHLAGHRIEDFTNCDLVIKAAGVPLDSPEIAAAKKAGVQVAMSTALFAKFAAEAGATIVGITGTRGKTTVSQMIYSSLIRANKPTILGGNVRGVSTLAMLPEVKPQDIVVLELDSWQLQGFGDLKISPHVAVFTNLMPDHQNYYKTMDEYFADKANIFLFQKEGDALIVGEQVADRITSPHATTPMPLPANWQLHVLGRHNRENAALAADALAALGLSQEEIRAGLESFEPVEGRLQFLREVQGAKIYNDNNATTPEATLAALRALIPHHEEKFGFRKPKYRGLALICGGSEKGLDLKELVNEMANRAVRVVVLSHPNYKGSERLMRELRAVDVSFEQAASLQEALSLALASKPDVVLFSPGFASFGMFKNEYDRNDEFVRLVQAL